MLNGFPNRPNNIIKQERRETNTEYASFTMSFHIFLLVNNKMDDESGSGNKGQRITKHETLNFLNSEVT